MTQPRLLAVDWGTSSLRAFLLGGGGAVLERLARDQGILKVSDGDFAAAFEDTCGPWLDVHPGLPVLMSGMIGSRQGWVEAPYRHCPCSVADLASECAALPLEGARAFVMPGLDSVGLSGAADVMRGEETQVAGAMALANVTDGLFCIPGTHSKWVRVEGARVMDFSTFMTGECFAVLKDHSILGRLMEGSDSDEAAFDEGLNRAKKPGGPLHHLFGVRSEGLVGNMAAESLESSVRLDMVMIPLLLHISQRRPHDGHAIKTRGEQVYTSSAGSTIGL